MSKKKNTGARCLKREFEMEYCPERQSFICTPETLSNPGSRQAIKGWLTSLQRDSHVSRLRMGANGGGATDDRNGWPDTHRIIEIVRPEWVFLENSAKLLSPFRKRAKPAYFGTVLRDLAESGYDARWGCLSAATFGAKHKRTRLWIVAHTGGKGWSEFLCMHSKGGLGQGGSYQDGKPRFSDPLDAIFSNITQLEKRLGESSICGVDDGIAHRVDRLAAVGDGQFPIVAARAWEYLGGE